jgi:hypothetical protein
MIIHDKSKSCWICYQVIDHALIDFMEKSQKSLDFGIVPENITLDKYETVLRIPEYTAAVTAPGKSAPGFEVVVVLIIVIAVSRKIKGV